MIDSFQIFIFCIWFIMMKKTILGSILVSSLVVSSISIACDFSPLQYNTGGILYNTGQWYYGTNLVKWSDYDSFEALDTNYAIQTYAKDKNSVYYMWNVITGADPASFGIISGTMYRLDSQYIYIQDKKYARTMVDISSLKQKGQFAMDMNHVYKANTLTIIPWLQEQHISTDQLPDEYAIDTNQQHLYYDGELLGRYQSIYVINPYLFHTSKTIFWPDGKKFGRVFSPLSKRASVFSDEEIMMFKKLDETWESYHDEYISGIQAQEDISESIYEDEYFSYVPSENRWSYCSNQVSYNTILPKPALASLFQKRANRLSASKRTSYATQINEALNTNKNLTPQDRVILVVALYTISG